MSSLSVHADEIRQQIYDLRAELRAMVRVVWSSPAHVADEMEADIVRLNREVEALKMNLYAAIKITEDAGGGTAT